MALWDTWLQKREDPAYKDFSALKTDIHSHLIPGLDDGSTDMEQSLEMLRGLKSLGFTRVITTPHIMADYYKNDAETILSGLSLLRDEARMAGIEIEIEVGAEYMVDDGFEEKARAGKLLTFGNNYVLLELSTFTPHPNLMAILFDMQVAGYNIVLAHVERYIYWFNHFGFFEELRNRNVLLQVNAMSFGGFYNAALRKNAIKLAEAGMVDLLGSDLHNVQSLSYLALSLRDKHLQKLLESGRLVNNQL